jgi:hypothetical protein
MVDVDVVGFFDNIDRGILIDLLNRKIDDKRFIRLIEGMLKAGYMEDWSFNATYSGTPQGGVVSPILANIYLHELDQFLAGMKAWFDRGERRAENPQYRNLTIGMYKRRLRVEGDLWCAKADAVTRPSNDGRHCNRKACTKPGVDQRLGGSKTVIRE